MTSINNMSPLVLSQVPEYLTADSPLFGEFLQTYYKYASQRNKAVGTIQNHGLEMDVDETSIVGLDHFYTQYAANFPKEIRYDKRNFIKLLNTIYESKGTEKSLKLVFRLLFNDQISVTYPSEQILRASGGIWSQDNFITLETRAGLPPQSLPYMLTVTNDFGDYTLVVSKVIKTSVLTHRFYYRAYEKVVFFDGQDVSIKNNDGDVVYVGKMVKTASRINIVDGGKNWQMGQVIILNGSTKPTISRVSRINSLGSITGLEIVEHGYNHEDSQNLIISPYPNKPSDASIVVTSVLTGMGIRHHYIDINDITDGCNESILGFSTSIDENAYFLEEYLIAGYMGYKVFGVFNEQASFSEGNIDLGLTIEKWSLSRANLILESDYVVKTRGMYYDDSGKLSNQEVKLQDNYYYQPFSYVINTSKDIREYEKILTVTHPAGMKHFSEVRKTLEYSFNFESSRAISFDTLTFLDTVSASHTNTLFMYKLLGDATIPSTDTYTLNFEKPLSDSISVVDGIYSLDVSKLVVDSTDTSTDTYTLTFSKPLVDDVFAVDSINNFDVSKPLVDSVIGNDAIFNALNKSINDAATAFQSDTADVVTTSYSETSYFSETYAVSEFNLTLN